MVKSPNSESNFIQKLIIIYVKIAVEVGNLYMVFMKKKVKN